MYLKHRALVIASKVPLEVLGALQRRYLRPCLQSQAIYVLIDCLSSSIAITRHILKQDLRYIGVEIPNIILKEESLTLVKIRSSFGHRLRVHMQCDLHNCRIFES